MVWNTVYLSVEWVNSFCYYSKSLTTMDHPVYSRGYDLYLYLTYCSNIDIKGKPGKGASINYVFKRGSKKCDKGRGDPKFCDIAFLLF